MCKLKAIFTTRMSDSALLFRKFYISLQSDLGKQAILLQLYLFSQYLEVKFIFDQTLFKVFPDLYIMTRQPDTYIFFLFFFFFSFFFFF